MTDLLKRIKSYLSMISPHITGRIAPCLLLEAAREIERLRLVLKSYLAANPEDDEEPVNDSWLRAIGFVEFGDRGSGLYFPTESECVVARGYRGQWLVNGVQIDRDIATHGELRRLCTALGVPLKEPA